MREGRALPGKAKKREAGYFGSPVFMNADLNKLLVKVSVRVPVAEQPEDLVPAAAQRCRAKLEVVEAAENCEVQVCADRLPEAALSLRFELAAPDRVPPFIELALGVAAKHPEAQLRRPAPHVSH